MNRHLGLLATLFFLLPILLPLLVLSCGRTGQTVIGRDYRIVVPALPDGELLSYRILATGQPVGTMILLTRRVQFLETPVFEVTNVTRTLAGKVERCDSAVVFLSRDSLTPIASFRFSWVGNAFTTTSARYQPGSVGVATYIEQQQQQIQRPLPFGPGYYDVDELLTLGRALQIAPQKVVELAIVIPMSTPLGGAVTKARFTPGIDQTVTVPAGTFDCTKLNIEMAEAGAELWYEKTGTHRLVKYQTSDTVLSMELIP